MRKFTGTFRRIIFLCIRKAIFERQTRQYQSPIQENIEEILSIRLKHHILECGPDQGGTG